MDVLQLQISRKIPHCRRQSSLIFNVRKLTERLACQSGNFQSAGDSCLSLQTCSTPHARFIFYCCNEGHRILLAGGTTIWPLLRTRRGETLYVSQRSLHRSSVSSSSTSGMPSAAVFFSIAAALPTSPASLSACSIPF